jgi:hypothetical protein
VNDRRDTWNPIGLPLATQIAGNISAIADDTLRAEGAPKAIGKRLINDISKSNQRELSRRCELFGKSAGCLLSRVVGYRTANTTKVAGVLNGTA